LNNYGDIISSSGSWVDLEAPCGTAGSALNTTVLKHLKPGGLIPFQPNPTQAYKNTKDIRLEPFDLLVNPDHDGHAHGSVYLDRTDSRHTDARFQIVNKTANIPTGMELCDFATAELYFEDIKNLENYGPYSIIGLSDGRIVGPMYGEYVSRELCDTGCQQVLIVDIQHPYEWYDFYLSGKVLKKWVKNENNTVSQNLDLSTIQILNAEIYDDTDFACYTTMNDNSVTYTQLTATYHADMKTLTLMDQYGFALNVFNLQAVYFGNSKIDSNQCTNYK
jgi:hypothetical protein